MDMHEKGETNGHTKGIRGDAQRGLHDGHELDTEGAGSRRTERSTAAAVRGAYVSHTGRRGAARIKTGAKAGSEKESSEETKASQIDPPALPYVMMSELRFLPDCAGVYFAIEESGEVAYIGQSINIKQRWRAHHIQDDLCDLSNLQSARRVRVAWLEVEETELDRLEIELIRRFKPKLNVSHIPVEPKAKPTYTGREVNRFMVKLRLDEILEESGQSLYWLAKQTGIKYPILFRYRHNQTEGIKFEQINAICIALECEPGDLFAFTPDKKKGGK